MAQTLVNLLSNAVTYNRLNGSVWLTVRAMRPTMRFDLRDTGLGIDPEEQGRLFTPFERLGAEATGIEGTGIGLVMVKSLIDAMHGRMGFASQVGEGSLFWVELKAAN